MLRDSEKDKKFIEKLKSPLKPTNDTRTSPEMESYLKELNDGTLKNEEKKEEKKMVPVCPHCKRHHAIKRTPSGMWCCGYCGLESTSPPHMQL